MVKEMEKLRKLLDAEKIEWRDASSVEGIELPEPVRFMTHIDRTHFDYEKYSWSVIQGQATYGGRSELLELMSNRVNHGEPIGWLTADNVMEILKCGTLNGEDV